MVALPKNVKCEYGHQRIAIRFPRKFPFPSLDVLLAPLLSNMIIAAASRSQVLPSTYNWCVNLAVRTESSSRPWTGLSHCRNKTRMRGVRCVLNENVNMTRSARPCKGRTTRDGSPDFLYCSDPPVVSPSSNLVTRR